VILVAGATGTLGTRLVRRLHARHLSVRVLTRDPGRAAHLAASGVQVVRGDLRDAASVRRAAAGAETIVMAAHGFSGTGGSSPDSVDRLGNGQLVDAATAVGAAVILVSVVGASPSSPLELFRAKYDAEVYARRSGVPLTVVRATAFIETWIQILSEPIRRAGRGLVFGRGQNPINFVSAEAVAALVERAVVDSGLRGQTIEIGGPSNVTLTEFVALLSTHAGRRGVPGRCQPAGHAAPAATAGVARDVDPAPPASALLRRAGGRGGRDGHARHDVRCVAALAALPGLAGDRYSAGAGRSFLRHRGR
jgi:uncharacterized protein YbjT (DUF2867 family)